MADLWLKLGPNSEFSSRVGLSSFSSGVSGRTEMVQVALIFAGTSSFL